MSEYNTMNYTQQGGDNTVIGGTLTINGEMVFGDGSTPMLSKITLADTADASAVRTAVRSLLQALQDAGLMAGE